MYVHIKIQRFLDSTNHVSRHRLNANTNCLFVFPANLNWKQNNNKKGFKKKIASRLNTIPLKIWFKRLKNIQFFSKNLRPFINSIFQNIIDNF